MKSRIININKTKLLAAPGLDLVAVLLLLLALPLAALGQANYATPYTFTTLAGLAGNWGSADGTGSAAWFYNPYGVAVDTNGNVYVADTYNNTIRKVTPAGVVTTLAGLAGSSGSADGTGSAARFYNPYGVAADGGGSVYVVDSNNHTVRKVTPAGVVTTLAGLAGSSGSADGTGSAARFYYPDGVAVDTTGNVYVADTYNCTIRKVTPAGVVTTLAGLAGSSGSADGTGSAARFNHPYGVAVDTGGTVYVVDSNNNTIRKVTPAGVVTTLAGVAGLYGSADGTGSAARFDYPDSVAVDLSGNVYVADTYNDTIRKMTPAGVVTTLAGLVGSSGSADGTGSAAQFYYPHGVAVDIVGNVYVADTSNNTIRKGVFVPFVLQVTATPTNGTVPLTVQFTSASIDNAGNAITRWAWTFGDGSTSAVQNPSHTYTAAGTFHPGLTASNNLGSAVVGSVPSVAASLPTVQVTANPTSGPLPLTVQFTSASVDSAGHAISNWAWNFGDGSTSALQNPSHTYTVVNYFYPSLTATNNIGVAVLSSVPSISTWLPTVQFTATPTVGGVPLVVQFTCPNTDSAGNAITHWNWTFGDGSSSTAQSPSHTYSSAGLFFPSLLVTNSNGTEISASGPGISAAAYSGLVLNGGFETGDFFGWTLNADGGLYDLVDTFYQSTEGIQPHTGSYFARLGQTGRLGYLSQTLATTAGANCLLSFWLNSPDGLTPNQFLVSWNGTLLFSGTDLPASGWTNLQFTVTATGSSTVLQFGFRNDPTAFGLDDISVMQLTPPLQVTLPPGATEGDGTLAGAGRVRIPAPLATNLTVVLSSSDTSQVTVPASAVILAGQTNALFDVTVVDDSVLDGTQMATITAAAPGFATGSATMAVFDNETASLHVLLPASATEGQGSVQGTVQISAPPGANVTVSLVSSDLSLFQVPASIVLPAGQTSVVFTATVTNEKLVGGDQTATVTAHVANWTDGAATITIHERVDHFQWSGTTSPQFTNRPFAVTLTAKDEFNVTVSSFTGTVTLSGSVPGGLRTNTLLPSPSFQASGSGGTYTVGNSFTPNTNITVTAVRHYFGTKVSIWTDTGTLLAAQNVTSVPGTWVETPLATPLQLLAGNTYRVTVLAPNVTFYWIYASSTPFPDGTVQQSYEGSGDVFPTFADLDLWLVDLKYTVGSPQPLPISPTVSGNFTNGTWTGNLTVSQPATNLTLLADDLAGHTGLANSIDVLTPNNLQLTMTALPEPVPVGSNLTYSLTVSNSGPDVSTVVVLTNILPVSANLVSVGLLQGSYTVIDNTVVCELGSLGTGSNLTVSITVTPTASGLMTNMATVSRAQAEDYLADNSAQQVSTVLVFLAIGDVSVIEGNSGTTNAVLPVTLSPPSSVPVTAHFETADGSATAGSDYASASGIVSFGPGETNKTITVVVNGDTTLEPNETFYVNLSAPVGALVTRSQGVGTIIDDDLKMFVPIFSDSFDADTSANWIVNRSSADTLATFGYDYSADGIPPAPNSVGGTTRGLKLKANLANGVVAALSLSPAGQNFPGDYQLHFDMWVNVNINGSGSTEHLTAGIGTAGNRVEWTGTGSTADGYWFAVDGEGGVVDYSPTTGDFEAFNGTTFQLTPSQVYAAGLGANCRGNGNSYYAATFPAGQTAPPAQGQSGSLAVGTVGLRWRDVIINKTDSRVTWSIDGLRIASFPNATLTASNIFVGYWDELASLSGNGSLSFGLVDNVRVEVPVVPAQFISQPQDQTAPCHSDVTFTVSALGTSPSYQWRKAGASLSGATASALTISNALCADSANYSVTVSNAVGVVTSRVATLTVVDTAAPAIFCPASVISTTAPGQCSTIANYSVTATDDCAVVSLVVFPPSGSTFPRGTNVVSCTATDCAGNTNTCAFTVTVVDAEPPVLVCPTNLTAAAVGTNGVQVFFTPTASDNCNGSVPVVCTPSSGSLFSLGTNTVTCAAKDSSGNTNTCSFTVTVTEAPPTLSIVLDGANCLISWPPTYSVYVLEQRARLDSAVDWAPVSTPATWDGSNFVVSLPLEQESRLFRLRRN